MDAGANLFWHLSLIPKLKCHTGNLRKTNEETWMVQWRLYVPSFFTGVLCLVLWCSLKIPSLVSLFIGSLLKLFQQGCGTWWPTCRPQVIKVSFRLQWLLHCAPGLGSSSPAWSTRGESRRILWRSGPTVSSEDSPQTEAAFAYLTSLHLQRQIRISAR